MNNDNGIFRCTINDDEYTFWTHADFVKPYIINFLKDKFPGKLIVRELNQIDLTIPEENLPIEVQATIAGHNPTRKTQSGHIHYAGFEQQIQKQINQNIAYYGMCWLFFDSELLRSMQDAINRRSSISINLDWFRKLMKENKLKVFIVGHNGIIEEKEYNDFDFLSKISQTCPIAAEKDDIILNKNKLKIYSNVVKIYDFTQNEIDEFYDNWKEYYKSNKINNMYINDQFTKFLRRQKDDRTKLYGNILHAMGQLSAINDLLELKNYNSSKYSASYLGIFDIEGGEGNKNAVTIFINRSDICQYFPGYVRNKETWDKLKGHNLNPRQFESIIKNGIKNYFWYEDKGDIVAESEQTEDKDINVTIESKDQIITVNIKDKTKQENIEDAWINKIKS